MKKIMLSNLLTINACILLLFCMYISYFTKYNYNLSIFVAFYILSISSVYTRYLAKYYNKNTETLNKNILGINIKISRKAKYIVLYLTSILILSGLIYAHTFLEERATIVSVSIFIILMFISKNIFNYEKNLNSSL